MSDFEVLQQHIIDLQARLTFQEDLLQTLDATVAEQDQTIFLLRKQLKQWESRLDDISHSVDSTANVGSEKPPHY